MSNCIEGHIGDARALTHSGERLIGHADNRQGIHIPTAGFSRSASANDSTMM